ncbi:hypothetical protein [Geodermatophilus sp. URMC 62]|uniref:hypothetical protein n=1 Tax=Geodermatophilus sp. URMC 62 TaxID=3423414 RepID=UPI00406CD798
MKLIIAGVVLGVLALLSIPSYNKATEHQESGYIIWTDSPLNIVSMERVLDTTQSLVPFYVGTVEWTRTEQVRMVDCGSVLNEIDPAVVYDGERTEIPMRLEGIKYEADTRDEAIQMAMAGQSGMNAVEGEGEHRGGPDDEAALYAYQEPICRDEMYAQKWETFITNPIGWLVIIVVGGALLGMMAGGGGGGGTVVGTLTRNVFSGGWTFRGR